MDSVPSDLNKIIAWVCPVCRGQQPLRPRHDGAEVCSSCQRVFPKKGQIIDFRVLAPGEASGWDLEKIEAAYKAMGDYEDNFAWAAKDGWSREVEQYRHDRLKGRVLEWLQGKSFKHILEVGCGSGYFLYQIEKVLKEPAQCLCGLEVSLEQLLKFCSRIEKTGKRYCLPILAGSERMPVSDGTFDLVVSSEVIEHIEDPDSALREIYRVLKPGGVFCLTTPSRFPTEFWKYFFQLPRILRRLMRGRSIKDMNKLDVYDQPLMGRRLKNILLSSGFRIKYFQRNIFLPHESYFPSFPAWMSDFFLKFGGFLEKHCPFLGLFLGLHFVAWVEKPKDGK